MMIKQELEARIANALTSTDVTSSDMSTLIEETTDAISEAAAAKERERAFDPTLSPDPKAARERMEDAMFMVGRLKTLLPRLEKLSHEVRDRETAAGYAAKRDALQAEGDAIEQQLVEVYHECCSRLLDVFARATAFADSVRHELPADIPPGVEPFRKFDPYVAQLLRDVVLPAPDDGSQKLWPLKSAGAFAADFAQSMAVPTHPGANWGDQHLQAERRRKVEAEQNRLADFYSDATASQEVRVNTEARAAAIRRAG